MRWVLRGIGLFSIIITARILHKEDFGIVAQATMVQALAMAIFDISASMLVIRERQPDREDIDSAWTVMALQGLVVCIAIILLSYPISIYFQEPRLIPVLCVVGLSTILVAMENIGIVFWRKELQFRKDFVFNITRRVVSTGTTIALALWLRTYWALVLGILVGAMLECALSYWFHPYRPRFCLTRSKKYVSFGMTMIPMNVAQFLRARVGQIVIGGTGSTAALGGYSVASELASSITQEIAVPLTRALFPNFAAIAEDKSKLTQVFLGVLGSVALVVSPMALVLSAFSHDIVAVVLGEKWVEQAPLIKWLAIYGATQGTLLLMSGSVLIAGGYEKLSAVSVWIQTILLASAAVIGGQLNGVEGVAMAVTLTSISYIPCCAWILRYAYALSIRRTLGVIARPALASLVIPVCALIDPFQEITPIFLRLVLSSLTAGALYVIAVWFLWRVSGSPSGPEAAVIGHLRTLLLKANVRRRS